MEFAMQFKPGVGNVFTFAGHIISLRAAFARSKN